MDITQITNDMNAAESLKADKVENPKATIGKDGFLKLLVAQLKYQDPLHPLTNDQFIQENTMFSQLEQLMNIDKSISSVSSKIKSNPKEYAASYLGKYISTGENDIKVTPTKIDPIEFNLSKEAKVTIHISNSEGEDIADIDLGKLQPGSHTFRWNGKDNKGNSVADGTYSVRITAQYDNGSQITLSRNVGKVVSVRFDGDKTVLITNTGQKVNLSDVVSVSDGG